MISSWAYLVTEPQSVKPVGAEMKARKVWQRKTGGKGSGKKQKKTLVLVPESCVPSTSFPWHLRLGQQQLNSANVDLKIECRWFKALSDRAKLKRFSIKKLLKEIKLYLASFLRGKNLCLNSAAVPINLFLLQENLFDVDVKNAWWHSDENSIPSVCRQCLSLVGAGSIQRITSYKRALLETPVPILNLKFNNIGPGQCLGDYLGSSGVESWCCFDASGLWTPLPLH